MFASPEGTNSAAGEENKALTNSGSVQLLVDRNLLFLQFSDSYLLNSFCFHQKQLRKAEVFFYIYRRSQKSSFLIRICIIFMIKHIDKVEHGFEGGFSLSL